MSLVIACVWVQANVPYGAEYVTRLKRMCMRHAPRPHDFICLTDRPYNLPSNVQAFQIPRPTPGVAGWWSKLELFGPAFTQAAGKGRRVLYLDLDVLVAGDLTEVAHYKVDDFDAGLALCPPGGTFQGKGPLKVVRAFNSSVMSFDAGAWPALYDDFRADVTRRLWGDQDWIGERLAGAPGVVTMPEAWFPRFSSFLPPGWHLGGPLPPMEFREARVVLVKKPKPHELVNYEWFNKAWGAK